MELLLLLLLLGAALAYAYPRKRRCENDYKYDHSLSGFLINIIANSIKITLGIFLVCVIISLTYNEKVEDYLDRETPACLSNDK